MVFLGVFFKSGSAALWPVFILAIIEITFSFDNAVLNSEVLSRMSRIWRTIFLTVGIAIAVFGVRLILPLVLVAATTGLGVGHVLDMALHHPDEYAENLHEGYPVIAAFGGVFLLMIGLRFLAEERETKWLPFIEHGIAKHRRPWLIPIAGAAVTTIIMATVLRPGDMRIVIAAGLGALTFLIIKGISTAIESRQAGGRVSKHHNWINFLYLEMLDASFSFDGVIAAFAITKDVVLIAAGLGIGALYVRSITVHLLEKGTLNDYRYLIHGAHYAIIILGLILILSMKVELPEWFTGLIGITIIAWAFISSIRHNRSHKLHPA
jgi:hypothetical protein